MKRKEQLETEFIIHRPSVSIKTTRGDTLVIQSYFPKDNPPHALRVMTLALEAAGVFETMGLKRPNT